MESVIGRFGRWTVGLAGALVLLAGVTDAETAAARTYTVVPGTAEAQWVARGIAYGKMDLGAGGGVSTSTEAEYGQYGRLWWWAPSHTAITGVRGAALLSNADGQQGILMLRNFGGHEGTLLGPGGAHDFNYSFTVGRQGFGVELRCFAARCPDNGSKAIASGTNFAITLHDGTDPDPAFGIYEHSDSGWWRRNVPIQFGSGDRGGGVLAYRGYVNGDQVDAGLAPCSFDDMRPCPLGNTDWLGANDTRQPPWHNGTNKVAVCAWDAAQNGWCREWAVKVDNAAPGLRFRNTQSPADPELIRVGVLEPHSGIKFGKIAYARDGTDEWHELPTAFQVGELRARIDSEAVPAGDYRFKAWAEDRVGNNSGEVFVRENGQPMVLRLPLRITSELRAGIGDGAQKRTVKYGRKPEVTGRLRTADGDPLASEKVLIDERYEPGSLEPQHTHQAMTDKEGRFALKLPAGPSRELHVSYPGSKRFRPAGTAPLDLDVRSGVKFKTSRKRVPAGKRVTFTGKVKHEAVQLPAQGKLIELQVKEGTRTWGTVGEAFSTRGDGRFRFPYRFGRFYSRPVRFRFRVKVTPEQGWPYKAPVRSRKRGVTVVP
jgi:hypothetical protein